MRLAPLLDDVGDARRRDHWGLDDVENSSTCNRSGAYLEPFTAFAPRGELDAALDAALRLGWICRALTIDITRPPCDGPDRDQEYAGLKVRLELAER